VGCDKALELDTGQAPKAISKADAESCCHTERNVANVTMISGPCTGGPNRTNLEPIRSTKTQSLVSDQPDYQSAPDRG
jgi:hypothetical protein